MPRRKILISAFGKALSVPGWAKKYGVPERNIRARLHLGWEAERAVSEPVGQSGKRLTTAEFIIRSKKVHGGRYRYSRTVYRSNKRKTTITCLVHGDFQQLPIHHMAGHGCPACGRVHQEPSPVTGS
jgi:hypothetical protein